MNSKIAILAVLSFPAVAFGQTQQGQKCRPVNVATVLEPGEKLLKMGDSYWACKTLVVADAKAVPAKVAAPSTAPLPAAWAPAAQPARTADSPAVQPATRAAQPVTQPAPSDGRKRLFVTDEPKDESIFLAAGGSGSQFNANRYSASGSSGSASGAYGYSQKGADPRLVEVQADFYKSCPNIIITNDPSRADLMLLFRREGGKRSSFFILGGLTGLAISAHMKVDGASVFNKDGDMVYATRERTVMNAVKAVCSHL
jgi:hypothetical protein